MMERKSISSNGFHDKISMTDIVKRLCDIIVSALCLIIFSPVFLVCYIAIKCDSEGKVIFSQERIGKGGKVFLIYKFRSIKINEEKEDNSIDPNNERITRVGKILRDHHLDELPQLWNILKGDMSFVGYRPEREFYVKQIIERDPRYVNLYALRPGATSYATLYNGYTDTMEKMLKRLEYDLYYLEHRSLWVDFKILVQTFFCIFSGKKF